MQPERVTFDRRFIAIALVLLVSTPLVAPLFRGAMIALAIVAAVLAALPAGCAAPGTADGAEQQTRHGLAETDTAEQKR